MSAGSESELSSCSGDGAVPFTGCKHMIDHRLWKLYEDIHIINIAHVLVRTRVSTMTEFRS